MSVRVTMPSFVVAALNWSRPRTIAELSHWTALGVACRM